MPAWLSLRHRRRRRSPARVVRSTSTARGRRTTASVAGGRYRAISWQRTWSSRVDDGIGWLTLRRPGTRNAVEPEFVEAAIGALDELPDGIGALVLAAEGPAFCVGVDLDMTQRFLSDGQVERTAPAPHRHALHHPEAAGPSGADGGSRCGRGGRRRRRVGVRLRPAVVGTSTVFVPGFQALGLSPDSGTSFHLAGRWAARRRSRPSSATGTSPPTSSGLRAGGRSGARRRGLGRRAAPGRRGGGGRSAALLATRRLIDAAPTHSFDEHLDAEEVTIKGLLTTADVAEGVAAFLETAPPEVPRSLTG